MRAQTHTHAHEHPHHAGTYACTHTHTHDVVPNISTSRTSKPWYLCQTEEHTERVTVQTTGSERASESARERASKQASERERARERARERERERKRESLAVFWGFARERLAVFWGFGVDIELIRTRCIIHFDDVLLSRGPRAPRAIMINSAAACDVVRRGRRRHRFVCLARAVSSQEKEEEEEGRRGEKRRGRRGFLTHQRQSVCIVQNHNFIDFRQPGQGECPLGSGTGSSSPRSLLVTPLGLHLPVGACVAKQAGRHVMERKARRWKIMECQ
jgi:hypothetical protein